MSVHYKKGYKYKVVEDFSVMTGILDFEYDGEYLELTALGVLFIKRNFMSDGPSGPTVDSKSFIRGSFVHDGLYFLLRQGVIPQKYRKQIDQLLRTICREDGMIRFRAGYVYRFVRMFGGKSAKLGKINPVLIAP